MPTYEYFCPSNGRTLEVFHGMSEKLLTWGELLDRAGVDLSDDTTPKDAPIQRNILGGQLMLKQEGHVQRELDSHVEAAKGPASSGQAHTGSCCGGGCG